MLLPCAVPTVLMVVGTEEDGEVSTVTGHDVQVLYRYIIILVTELALATLNSHMTGGGGPRTSGGGRKKKRE